MTKRKERARERDIRRKEKEMDWKIEREKLESFGTKRTKINNDPPSPTSQDNKIEKKKRRKELRSEINKSQMTKSDEDQEIA